MALELRDFDELDTATVTALADETAARLADDNPSLDVSRGVIRELLIHTHAVLDAQRLANIADIMSARSLKQIEADPALANEDVVDDVLSNFRVTRKEGQLATGLITVVVSTNNTVTIGQGSVWQADGRRFITPRVFTAKAEEGLVTSPGDRLITPLGNNQFSFTISVEAEEAGSGANVLKNTLVTPEIVPDNYLTSYATDDFTGGTDEETNQELIDRFKQGIASRVPSNRVNMSAMLLESFPTVIRDSVIGYGDAEMTRNRTSLFPVAFGGRIDWYIRTQAGLQQKTVTRTATLISKSSNNLSLWQVGIPRNLAPGFYEIAAIVPEGSTDTEGSFTVESDIRGFDTGSDEVYPDGLTAPQAAYSAYATATIQFSDNETDVSGMDVGDTADYDITFLMQPLIAEIQSYVNSRNVAHVTADCLVKAPVPAITSVNFTIRKTTGQPDPDLTSLRAAVAAVINSIGFTGEIYGSKLYEEIAKYLIAGQTAFNLDVLCRILFPDGSEVYRRSGELITVPDAPESGVSARTVQFFCAPERVGITIVTAGTR